MAAGQRRTLGGVPPARRRAPLLLALALGLRGAFLRLRLRLGRAGLAPRRRGPLGAPPAAAASAAAASSWWVLRPRGRAVAVTGSAGAGAAASVGAGWSSRRDRRRKRRSKRILSLMSRARAKGGRAGGKSTCCAGLVLSKVVNMTSCSRLARDPATRSYAAAAGRSFVRRVLITRRRWLRRAQAHGSICP